MKAIRYKESKQWVVIKADSVGFQYPQIVPEPYPTTLESIEALKEVLGYLRHDMKPDELELVDVEIITSEMKEQFGKQEYDRGVADAKAKMYSLFEELWWKRLSAQEIGLMPEDYDAEPDIRKDFETWYKSQEGK